MAGERWLHLCLKSLAHWPVGRWRRGRGQVRCILELTLNAFSAIYTPVSGRKQLWSSYSLLKLLSIIMFAGKKKKKKKRQKKLEQQGTDPVINPKSYSLVTHIPQGHMQWQLSLPKQLKIPKWPWSRVEPGKLPRPPPGWPHRVCWQPPLKHSLEPRGTTGRSAPLLPLTGNCWASVWALLPADKL